MDPIHTNIFRIVRLIGARVVFAIAELQPSGEILVEYFEPPDPFLTREESIAMNLEVLAIRKALVLHSSVQPPTVPLTPVFYEEGDVVGLTKLDSKS
jgi:hypothetical protein